MDQTLISHAPGRIAVSAAVQHPAGCTCSWYTVMPRLGRTPRPPAGGFPTDMSWRESLRFGVIRLGGCHGRHPDGVRVELPNANRSIATIAHRVAAAMRLWRWAPSLSPVPSPFVIRSQS